MTDDELRLLTRAALLTERVKTMLACAHMPNFESGDYSVHIPPIPMAEVEEAVEALGDDELLRKTMGRVRAKAVLVALAKLEEMGHRVPPGTGYKLCEEARRESI